jgi:hypothetical protein
MRARSTSRGPTRLAAASRQARGSPTRSGAVRAASPSRRSVGMRLALRKREVGHHKHQLAPPGRARKPQKVLSPLSGRLVALEKASLDVVQLGDDLDALDVARPAERTKRGRVARAVAGSSRGGGRGRPRPILRRPSVATCRDRPPESRGRTCAREVAAVRISAVEAQTRHHFIDSRMNSSPLSTVSSVSPQVQFLGP